jgi:integrase/recombinase XerD
VRDFLRQFRTDNVPTRQDNWKVLSMLYGHLLRELRPDLPNPMLRVEKPRFRKKAGQRLSRQQAKAVIAAISSPLEWALVAAFFGLRLRRAEAERLLPQDIKDDFLVVRGKERTEELPLLPEMRERLLGVTTDGSVLPVRGDAMHYHIAKLIRRAGVSGVRASPHTLRNSAGALWSTFGGDWTANRQLLRHSAKTMTDHYSPLTLDELREKDRLHNPMVCLTRELGLAPGEPASGCPNTSSAPR